MKTCSFFTILFLLCVCKCNAQLFGTIEPAHQRIGIAYNLPIKYNIGIYTHAWYGTIKKEIEQSCFSTNTFKIGAGFSYILKNENSIFIGINKSYYYNTYFKGFPFADMSLIHYTSFEIGCTMKVERFTLLMMSDLLNWESMIGINYQLKK